MYYKDEVSVRVESVSKRFELYDRPADRLKQFVIPNLLKKFNKEPKHYFNEFWALRDVSFEVKRGEAFGIIGRNGSGKSTLLQIITGTLSPTSGTVSTQGRVAALLELGSGFDLEFSGRENIFLNGSLLGFSHQEMEERFDQIAAFADIGAHLEQPVKSYSSGMIVRLAIAIQTQINPDLLIVDEALAVGDALFQKKCYRQIDKMLSDGCTLLFVSHEQEIVRSLTQRAIFLKNGSIARYGNTVDVLFSYREFLQEQEADAFASLNNSNIERKVDPGSKAYGSLHVEIIDAFFVDENGKIITACYVGDRISIIVNCICHEDVENLNIAFRLINKEGVKITTWGTLNEDMPLFDEFEKDTFWAKKFTERQRFSVQFDGVCTLGANLYELQVVAAREHERYYGNQQILHWKDEIAHLTVLLRQKEYVFDGVCDMGFRRLKTEFSGIQDGCLDKKNE